jgi:DNA repair exonuclease SbcCD ATPase subunit
MVSELAGTKHFPHRYYKCGSRGSYKARNIGTACGTPSIRAEELERRVWDEIEKVIYDPQIVVKRLEERESEERRQGYEEQMGFVDAQISELLKERAKFEAAFQHDIYTLDEFAEKMKDVRARMQTLEFSKSKLQAKINETQSIEEQKKVVLAGLERIRQEIEQARQAGRTPNEIPFLLKRRIVTHMVDVIYVDADKREFTIEGEIEGTFPIDVDDFDRNSDPESSDARNPRRRLTAEEKKKWKRRPRKRKKAGLG